jgi:hypothetical protein
VELDLSRLPGTYNPRQCDCDFCRKHGAAYVSDVHGSLLIRIRDERNSGMYRQGNGLAECLLCRNCGVLVSVLYRAEQGLYAAVNVNATDVRTDFGARQTISPKKLTETDKVQRWQEIWFSKVDLIAAS